MAKYLTTAEAAEIADVNIDTIRRWAAKGYIKSHRTTGGHRRYDELSLIKYLNSKLDGNVKKKTVIYGRVRDEKNKALLDSQIEVLKAFCIDNNYDFEIVTDFGSGLDYSRNGLINLIKLIETNAIDKIIVINSNDIVSIGYNFIKEICKYHDVEIITLAKEEDDITSNDSEFLYKTVTSIAKELYGENTVEYIEFINNLLSKK